MGSLIPNHVWWLRITKYCYSCQRTSRALTSFCYFHSTMASSSYSSHTHTVSKIPISFKENKMALTCSNFQLSCLQHCQKKKKQPRMSLRECDSSFTISFPLHVTNFSLLISRQKNKTTKNTHMLYQPASFQSIAVDRWPFSNNCKSN